MDNIVFTGLQHWNIPIGSNAKNIALEMSKTRKVLYVNKPRSLSIANKWVNRAQRLEQINENLYILEPPMSTLPVGQITCSWLFDALNYVNNWIMAHSIRKACAELGMIDYVHIIDNDVYQSFYLKEMLDAKLTVYYRRDNLYLAPFWRLHVSRIEPKIVAKSDLVVTNSPHLADAVRDYNANVHYVGQGVDLLSYTADRVYDKPIELSGLKKPMVGYVGAIRSARLDADLIYEVAKMMPDINFVMVGPQDDVFASHKLHKLKNVLFIPPTPPQNIPQYIAHFDICMNPQLLNEITKGNYPRKIDEYLALGKPTIATYTPTMKMFADCVSLCTGVQEYVATIRNLLSIDDTQELKSQRIAVANSHSWENCVKLICEKIEKT